MSKEENNSPTIGRDKVVEIIHSVIEKVGSAEESSRENIYNELRVLQDIIAQTREDIKQTGISSIGGDHINTATDELDAAASATEEATETIMDCCDAIGVKTADLDPGCRDDIQVQVTKILEACTFQDITGQRITKVVKSLKAIENKIASLLELIPFAEGERNNKDGDARIGDARLLNGPQLPEKAINQADIDKLLADLF